MEVNGGLVVKKKLLNIMKEKASLKETNYFNNVEKLKTHEKGKSDYLQSFSNSSFSFVLKLSNDRSSLIGPGSSFQTLAPPTEIVRCRKVGEKIVVAGISCPIMMSRLRFCKLVINLFRYSFVIYFVDQNCRVIFN